MKRGGQCVQFEPVPEAVGTQQHHVPGLQIERSAEVERDRLGVAAQADVHEIAQWMGAAGGLRKVAGLYQRFDMAVVAGLLSHRATAQQIGAAVAGVDPPGLAIADDRGDTGRARALVDRHAFTDAEHDPVRGVERGPEEFVRVGCTAGLETLDDAIHRDRRGTGAVGVAAHAVRDHEQGRAVDGQCDGTVLVLFAVAFPRRTGGLDSQGGLPFRMR